MPVLTGCLWTRVTGTPRRLATLVMSENGALSVSYDGAAIRDRMPGLSLMHDLAMHRELIYPANYANLLPPSVAELAPPPHPAGRLNPQRVIVEALAERVYAERGWKPANQQQREWDLLMLSGRGSVGVLDVFPSDEQAMQWYATIPQVINLLRDADGVAAAFRASVASTAMVAVDMLGSGKSATLPTLGGMMPKAIAIYDPVSSDVTMQIGGGRKVEIGPGIPVIVKVETSGYTGIVELEAMAYRACAAVGLPVPRTWTIRPDNFRPMLLVERLDIGPHGAAEAMESVYSVLFEATAHRLQGRKITAPDAAPYDMVATGMMSPAFPGLSARRAAGNQLFRQVMMALLTGNGDLHLRNLAFLGTRAACRLSPVFDPAPMRAWDDHNIVMACNMGSLDLSGRVAPQALSEGIASFAAICGLSTNERTQIIAQCLAAGSVFLADVKTAETIPEAQKLNLSRRIGQIRPLVEMLIRPTQSAVRNLFQDDDQADRLEPR